MSLADRGMVEALRDLYRLRYREPCLLPGHEVLACWQRAVGIDWVRDTDRMTVKLMRRQDTGMDA